MGMDQSEVFVAPEFKEREHINVMLSEPNAGWIFSQAHDNRLDFYMKVKELSFNSPYRFHTGNTGRLMIQFAREMIVEHALKADMDYLLFIDDDMIVPHNLFEHLVQVDADIAAPLAFGRRWPHEPVIYDIDRKEDDKGNLTLDSQPRADYEKNAIIDVDAVGFGVVLIKLDLVRKMPQPWFFINQPIGEDILFCLRARQHVPDCTIKVNTGLKVGHLSDPPMITERDFDKVKITDQYKTFKKEQKEKHAGRH